MAQLQFSNGDTPNTWVERYGDGSLGALSVSSDITDSTPNTSCSGTLSSTTLTVGSATGFSNNDLVLIHQSRNGGDTAGDWMLNKILSGSGTTTWGLKYPLTKNFGTTAQVYLLRQYTTASIDALRTVTLRQFNGSTGNIYAVLASTSITVAGIINTGGPGQSGGYSTSGGGFRGATTQGGQGEGVGGVGALNSVNTVANGSGGGGGNGSQSGAGGGGNAIAGTTGGGATPGVGGSSSGNSSLTVMTFGGGGGRGGGTSGEGGYGGGMVLLISPVITVTGSILAEGTDGQSGASPGAGGGGGGGGSILFKGRSITLGTNLVKARGGLGGSGGGGGNGGAGSNGRIHADYTDTISGTTTPTLDATQDNSFTTTTSTSSTTSRTTSTTTTVSMTTSTSTTSTSRTTSTSTTSTSTTSTSTTSTSSSTSTTSTSTTLELVFRVEVV